MVLRRPLRIDEAVTRAFVHFYPVGDTPPGEGRAKFLHIRQRDQVVGLGEMSEVRNLDQGLAGCRAKRRRP